MNIKCNTCNNVNMVQDETSWIDRKCQSCGILQCDKPKTESLLFTLQAQLKTNFDKTLNEMSKIIFEYTCSILKKRYRRYFQAGMTIGDKGWEATGEIIKDFLEKPDYKIEGSFAGIIKLKILWVLFNKNENQAGHIRDRKDVYFRDITKTNFANLYEYVKEYEVDGWEATIPKRYTPKHDTEKGYRIVFTKQLDAMSLDYENNDSDEKYKTQLVYTNTSEIDEINFNLDKEDLYESIENIIFDKDLDNKSLVKKMIAIQIFLQRGEIYSDKFFDLYGRIGKDLFMECIENIKQELLHRGSK